MKKLLISALLLGAFFNPNFVSAQTDYSGREKVYRATHTKMTELKHTKLKVGFDYQKEQLNGEGWLTAAPYFYATDSLVLNAKAMLIHEVALDRNGAKQPLKFDYKNDMLKINLDKVYQKGQQYTVYIKYTARPNEVTQQGSAAISDAKGLYFINAQGKDPDKPTQIWTQGETESSSAWFPTIDKTNQKTTQEIYMTVPDKYVTLSNGYLKESKKEANGLRTDHWVMDKPHSPYLFFMGVGDYAVVRDKWRNIPVDYYVEKDYEPYAKQIFGNTPEMMEFYSKILKYDYPWNKYAQITGRDYISGAMENTTATLHMEMAQQKPGDLIDENRWESTIAHELFHHWFGDLVTAESWSNLTVNESFANYSEYLWFEHKYGKDEADYHLLTDVDRYKHTPTDFNKDLVRFDYDSREDMFDLVTYNKGGGILHMLRNYLGDEAFFAGLNHYLKTYEYKNAEAHQLRLALEEVSGRDLNWFFNQWFFNNGHPKLDVKYSYEPVKKQITVNVQQTQGTDLYFQFPLAIDIYENGKATRHEVWADAKANNSFSFNVTKQPDLVDFNADGVLLAEVNDNKTAEQFYYQALNAKSLKSRYDAVKKTAENADKDEKAVRTLIAVLKDPSFRLRIEALNALDLSKPNQLKLAGAEVERLANNDPKTLVQGAAIGALGKSNDLRYLPIYEKGLTAVSNSVKGNSLAAMAKVAPERVATAAENVDLSNASEDLMTTLLPIIVENKITKHQPAIVGIVAFYPFVAMQQPDLAKPAEEGFNWIMSTDSPEATAKLTKLLTQVKSQIGQNPQAQMMVVKMLQSGLSLKMAALKANPQNKNINSQIDMINATIEAYK